MIAKPHRSLGQALTTLRAVLRSSGMCRATSRAPKRKNCPTLTGSTSVRDFTVAARAFHGDPCDRLDQRLRRDPS